MKKKILSLVSCLALMLTGITAVACSPTQTPQTPPPAVDQPMTGVTMADRTVTYDGTSHSLSVANAPANASIKYSYNGVDCDGVTNANTYVVTATVSAPGYETKTLTATLTINPATMDATLSSSSVEYNGSKHSLILEGAPQNATVVYTYNNLECDGVTEAGTYSVTATASAPNYETITLNATLIITNPSLKDIEGLTLNGYEVEYDGNIHSILINGKLPENASVKYTYNGIECDGVDDIGSYTVNATVSAPGYNSLTLTATLKISQTITDKEITNVTLKKQTIIEYDGQAHSVKVEGNLPAGAVIVYTYNGEEKHGVTDQGKYTVVATITAPGYKTLVLEGTLTIINPEKQLFSINNNGTIFFQNSLDDDCLYSYKNGTLTKINKDIAQYMISDGTNMFYCSSSLLSNVIKSVNGSSVSSLASVNGEWLTTDGTYIYYAVNNMLTGSDENGIYKLKISPDNDAERTPVKLIGDKASYLTYHNGYVYYANSSNKKYLSRISTSPSANPVSECLMEEAVSYIINDGNDLYFDASNGLASALYKYNITTKSKTKLTTDSGKYLTKIGNYIYYVNNDLITGNSKGKGIYKVSINGNGAFSSGEQVIETEEGDGVYSLTGDGVYLYYYKLNDNHFYRNSADGNNEIDLMKGFTPSDSATLSGYSKLAEYKGEIYYTDPTDNSTLYKYNPTTKNRTKVLSDSVSNVYFHNGYMFYSTFNLTNYALMRMNLTTNEIQKVISERCDNLIFDGNTIYYVQISGGLFSNKIKSISVDGTNETVICDGKNQWVQGFEKINNVFYYVINPSFGYKYIYSYNADTKKEESLGIKAENFVIANNKIYYYSHTENTFSACDLDGSNSFDIMTDVTIEDMHVSQNTIYFSSTHKDNTGLFKYDISANNPTATQISTKKAHGITVYEGTVYFLNTSVSYVKDYPVQASESCSGKLESVIAK